MDVLNSVSRPSASWSSVNLAEAVPGVMTPLTASVWVPASEMGLRSPFRAMGVLAADSAGIPDDPLDRITGAFFGRMAVRVDFLCAMGDLIPGQSGESLSRDFFGFVPDEFVSKPSLRRLPAILAHYPYTLATVARRMDRDRAQVDSWWRSSIDGLDSRSTDQVRVLLDEARRRFTRALELQAIVSACAIQLVSDQLSSLASSVEVDVTDLLRGHGSHEEATVLADQWEVSRGGLHIDEFLARHGYHCAGEGEVASVSWREDSTPVRNIVERFSAMPDSESPILRAEELARRGVLAEQRLRRESRAGRARIGITLRLARRFIPLRGVGKVTYLQTIDVLRACARRLGADAVALGLLPTAEDAFYFTVDELRKPLAADASAIATERRTQRESYGAMTPPATWRGTPVPVSVTGHATSPNTTAVQGVGVSPGRVTGRAVVVTDPADAEVDDGDILVAVTTDPSWVSLMYLSSALVVDIGGMMSHAAVVARELDIPCVMNTGNGTTAIRTGDVITVDGSTGAVDVAAREEPSREPSAT